MEEKQIKSALELAMDRFGSSQEGPVLDDEAKKAIKVLRAEYEAKIAEQDILLQERLKKIHWREPDSREKKEQIQRETAEARRILEAERERKIQSIREGKKS